MIVDELTVGEETADLRLDKFLSLAFRDYSRSFLQRAIREGRVTLGGRSVKPRHLVRAGDAVRVELPVLLEDHLEPEPIPLDILFEDEHLLVVNKPADLVVHPSRGHSHGTLANGLLHHCREHVSDVNGPLRPGIVHRLDRDTSGVLVCAKTNAAHRGLAEQFKDRRVHKEYIAVVRGRMEQDSGEISLPIGRDRRMRERMRVRTYGGRSAVSRYFTLERLGDFSVVRVEPRTGRTHQIRVHLSAERHPIVADALYGGGEALRASEIRSGKVPSSGERPLIARQALHARAIRFTHPVTGKQVSVQAALPQDIAGLIEALRTASQ